jgi:hypothetical protein
MNLTTVYVDRVNRELDHLLLFQPGTDRGLP